MVTAGLAFAGVDELAESIRAREVSSLEVVDESLARIERFERLNAFTQVFGDAARARAQALDVSLAHGAEPGPLHGVPVAVKDLLAVEGFPTTCGTGSRRDAPPAAANAEAVAALLGAGAVIVGATNLHEWADGPTSDNPHFGAVLNPWDEQRVAGGSSGGSAVAVAAGLAHVGIGSDTAGSVRIPAACTGTSALKVTTGRVSMRGVHPVSWTLDTVGPHGRTVADLVRPYRALAGDDRPLPAPALAGTRIGVERSFFLADPRADARVVGAVDAVLDELRAAGAAVVDLSLPELEGAEAAEYAIILAEASAAHDGAYRANRREYGAEIRGYLATGDLVLAVDYIRALRFRTVLYDAFERALSDVDFLVSPVLPVLPPGFGDRDGIGQLWRYTLPANVAGLPALAQPCGTVDGLPVALQLMAGAGRELDLLAFGRLLEQTFAWSPGTPPGVADA